MQHASFGFILRNDSVKHNLHGRMTWQITALLCLTFLSFCIQCPEFDN